MRLGIAVKAAAGGRKRSDARLDDAGIPEHRGQNRVRRWEDAQSRRLAQSLPCGKLKLARLCGKVSRLVGSDPFFSPGRR